MKINNLIKITAVNLLILLSFSKISCAAAMLFDEDVIEERVEKSFADQTKIAVDSYNIKESPKCEIFKRNTYKLWKSQYECFYSLIEAFSNVYEYAQYKSAYYEQFRISLMQLSDSLIDIYNESKDHRDFNKSIISNLKQYKEITNFDEWSAFTKCIYNLLKAINITDSEKDIFIKIFKYILGNDYALESNSIFAYLANAKSKVDKINTISDILDNKVIIPSEIGIEFESIINCLIKELNAHELQIVFNYAISNLEFFELSQTVQSIFVKKNQKNDQTLKIIDLVIKHENATSLDKLDLNNKIYLDINHIVSLPSDDYKIAGLHVWKKDNPDKISRKLVVSYKKKDYCFKCRCLFKSTKN